MVDINNRGGRVDKTKGARQGSKAVATQTDPPDHATLPLEPLTHHFRGTAPWQHVAIKQSSGGCPIPGGKVLGSQQPLQAVNSTEQGAAVAEVSSSELQQQ